MLYDGMINERRQMKKKVNTRNKISLPCKNLILQSVADCAGLAISKLLDHSEPAAMATHVPQLTFVIGDDGMRAAARGDVVRNHFSRPAIAKRDFQQAAVSMASHPYRSLLVKHQSVRIGARRQFPLFEYLLCRIEARQPIAGHDCNIDFPVRRSRRIASEFRRRRRTGKSILQSW